MDFKPGCWFAVLVFLVLIAGTGFAVEAIRNHVDCVEQSEDCPQAILSSSSALSVPL